MTAIPVMINNIQFDDYRDGAAYIVGTSRQELKETNVRKVLRNMLRSSKHYCIVYNEFRVAKIP